MMVRGRGKKRGKEEGKDSEWCCMIENISRVNKLNNNLPLQYIKMKGMKAKIGWDGGEEERGEK